MIPFLAPLALKLSPVGRFLKRVPRWVWIALAVLAVILAGAWWHGRQVKAFGNERFAAGYAKRVAEESAEAARRAARDVEITAPIRRKTDETIASNARHADALRVRGPGAAAACVNPVPAGPGRRDAPVGGADAAADRVPDPQRIIVPFPWLVDSGERCDGALAEASAWREWHAKLTADRAPPAQ